MIGKDPAFAWRRVASCPRIVGVVPFALDELVELSPSFRGSGLVPHDILRPVTDAQGIRAPGGRTEVCRLFYRIDETEPGNRRGMVNLRTVGGRLGNLHF